MLKGKQGRFRQNLLGSVSTIRPLGDRASAPTELHQRGLPKKMVLSCSSVHLPRASTGARPGRTVKQVKKLVEKEKGEVGMSRQGHRQHPVTLTWCRRCIVWASRPSRAAP